MAVKKRPQRKLQLTTAHVLRGASTEQVFTIKKVFNSTEFIPGDTLNLKNVDDLVASRDWNIEITAP